MADLNAVNDDVLMDLSDEDDGGLPNDSDYVSDQSEDLEDCISREMNSPQILALNRRTRHCLISFYYCTPSEAIAICAPCMINLADAGGPMIAVRKHEIDVQNALCGRSCGNCRLPMYMIIPCNMCPVCVV